MAIDPQTAYDRLLYTLAEFHSAVIHSTDPDEPAVLTAADQLADAYTVYDDALYTQFGVETPLDTYLEDDDDFDDDFDADEDDDDYDDEDDFDTDDDDFDDFDADEDDDDYDFNDLADEDDDADY
ncbi:MAG: hypothetical protein Q4E03_04760 [Trueperella sp.]|nr:hypothetical protein [Trueperella sp.]